MSIRLPLKTVLDFTNTQVPGSSVFSQTFQIPQDTDGVVVKCETSSIAGGGTCQLWLQTSDDGGTTYYDVLSLPTVDNHAANAARWAAAPVFGIGMRSAGGPTASAASGTTQYSIMGVTGNVIASALAANQNSGLPILGLQNRIVGKYSGTVNANDGVRVKVLCNSQSKS